MVAAYHLAHHCVGLLVLTKATPRPNFVAPRRHIDFDMIQKLAARRDNTDPPGSHIVACGDVDQIPTTWPWGTPDQGGRGKNWVAFAVFEIDGTEKELKRFGRQFLKELTRRVQIEKNWTDDQYPRRTKHQFYLQRHPSGTPFDAPRCQLAIRKRALSVSFLKKLKPWRFRLLYPTP